MSEKTNGRQRPSADAVKLRIDYEPYIWEAFGIDVTSWAVITNQIYPAAKTRAAIYMAIRYCKARGFDILKRPVHIVPIWDSSANDGRGGTVETVWSGINEQMTTAHRTGQFAGMGRVEYGPMVEKTFEVELTKKGGAKYTKKEKVRFPEYAQVAVYRIVAGQKCTFEGPEVFYEEAYGQLQGKELPNSMWARRPHGQLAKCAKAAAVRDAFPEEVGSEPAFEEIRNAVIDGDAEQVPQKMAQIEDTRGRDVQMGTVDHDPETGEIKEPAQAKSAPMEETKTKATGGRKRAAGPATKKAAPAASSEPPPDDPGDPGHGGIPAEPYESAPAPGPGGKQADGPPADQQIAGAEPQQADAAPRRRRTAANPALANLFEKEAQ